jgi:hypothetical protein
MGGCTIQKFLQVKYVELSKICGFSTENILQILGRGHGDGLYSHTLKTVTVLCNVATKLATDNTLLVKGIKIEHTPAQIASHINSVCPDKFNFIRYCTGSDKHTKIIKSSQEILDYILADKRSQAKSQISNTFKKLKDLNLSKADIFTLLRGNAGTGTGQAQLIESISIYREQFHLKDCDIVLLLSGHMGVTEIQKFLRCKYKELIESGFSSQDIFQILGSGQGSGLALNTFKIVKVLSNVAVLLATDIKKFCIEDDPLTLVQIVSYINSACADKYKLIQFCTCSSDDSCTTITESSKDILFYLLSDDSTRKTLRHDGRARQASIKATVVPVGDQNEKVQAVTKTGKRKISSAVQVEEVRKQFKKKEE